jgi:predicted homoserine dehydrogenase-like protein
VILNHSARGAATVRIALTGANGGFGRTFLAQLASTPEIVPTVLVDPDRHGVQRLLADLGIDGADITLATSLAEIPFDRVDVLVEACGRVPAGHAYAEAALAAGTHVVMTSKEVDTVVGVDLAHRAAEAGLNYLPADGDQPANLLRLLDWVAACGLDVVAVGKSGEYDLNFDPATGELTQDGNTVAVPELAGLLALGDDVRATLSARTAAVATLKRAAAADPCEMTVVAMRTGVSADVETMHYPVVRPDELADVYALREDGGLLSRDGVIDVFSALRLPGEASFAGGVFAVVRTGDAVTWEMLRGKGHVVSRDGRYACLYWPYHAMGVETPLTIHAAVAGTTPANVAPTTVLAARTVRDLPAGTSFTVAGHHHEIDGTAAVMVPPASGIAPFYLLDGATSTRPLAAGELVRLDDLTDVAPGPLRAWLDGLARHSDLTVEAPA